MLDEADRSLHDALCVIRCLVKRRALIAGGGAPETEMSLKLMEHARGLSGMEQYCFRAFAEALEIIPYTLAENAGLNPIETVTELRNRHNLGKSKGGGGLQGRGFALCHRRLILFQILTLSDRLTELDLSHPYAQRLRPLISCLFISSFQMACQSNEK